MADDWRRWVRELQQQYMRTEYARMRDMERKLREFQEFTDQRMALVSLILVTLDAQAE